MLTRSAAKSKAVLPETKTTTASHSKGKVKAIVVETVRSPLMERKTTHLQSSAKTQKSAFDSSRRKSILKKQSSFDGSASQSSSNSSSSTNIDKTSVSPARKQVIFVDDKENAAQRDDVYTIDHATIVVTTTSSRPLKTQLFSPIVPPQLQQQLDKDKSEEKDTLVPMVKVQEVVVVLDDGTYDENDDAPVLVLADEPYHMNETASATATVGHDESMMTLHDDDDDDEEEQAEESPEEMVGRSWTDWNLEDMVDEASTTTETATINEDTIVVGDEEEHVVKRDSWLDVSAIVLALVFFVVPFLLGPSAAVAPTQSFDAMVPAWMAMEKTSHPVCIEGAPTPDPAMLASSSKPSVGKVADVLKQQAVDTLYDAMEQKWNAPPSWLAAEQYAY
jgi:hypothetical protein